MPGLWLLSKHAKFEMRRRNVPYEHLAATLDTPEQIVPGDAGKMVYQRRFLFDTGPMLLRAVVADQGDVLVVVTVYLTSKIAKYWSQL